MTSFSQGPKILRTIDVDTLPLRLRRNGHAAQ